MLFLTLDPRPQSLETVLADLKAKKEDGYILCGFEVSVPALAQALDYNVDPQHSGGDSQTSCIKAIAQGVLAPAIAERLATGKDMLWATIRTDLDSIGAMAVQLLINQCGETTLEACSDRLPPEVLKRVEQIHRADCSRTDCWEPRPLFSQDSPGYEHNECLGAIAKAVADFKVPLDSRVAWVTEWLELGIEPGPYREDWLKEQDEIRSALENGETTVAVDGNMAIVKSRLRAATSIGYAHAPVLICYNPEFPMEGTRGLKYSVCQYSEGYIDMEAVKAKLQLLEPGWGGSPTFLGSPQNEPSVLTPEQVLGIVRNHLI